MGTNILQNSSFSDALTGWVRMNHVELVTGSAARNNGPSIKLTAVKSESQSGIRQYFDAQPGESYVLSFWARGQQNLQLNNNFGYVNSEGTSWVNGAPMILGSNENANYRRFTRQFVFPSDMRSTRVYIEISAAAVMIDMGEVYIDDIEVYKEDFVSDSAHPAGTSYLDDQSFEKTASCGTTSGVVVDPTNARTGYKVLKLTGNKYHNFSCSSAPVGKAYTVSFYAKAGTDDTSIAVCYSFIDAEGTYQFVTAGYTPVLNSNYQRYEIRVPIPSTAQRVNNIAFCVVPSYDSKIAWVDDCKIVENPIPFCEGNLVKTTQDNVFVRQGPSRNDDGTKVSIGCTLLIEGYSEGQLYNGSNIWVKVRWCTYSAGVFTVTSRYIHASCVEEVINLVPSQKLNTMLTIAKSLVGTSGANLNLKGAWCQLLLYWLCYVTDISVAQIPVHAGVTADAVDWLTERGRYVDHALNPSFLPYPGCWIYYLNVNSTDRMSHVGLVVERNGNSLTCIEGNLGSGSQIDRLVQLVTIPDCTASTVTVNQQQKYIKGYGLNPYI